MFSELAPSTTTLTAAAVLSVPALAVFLFHLIQNLRRSWNPPFPYPPGPKGELLFGNARQMPEKSQWLAFANWGKKYGGYVFCRVFNAPYLILNDAKSAIDLLERRSTIYSDRPVSVMANDLIGWDFNMTFVPYGSKWKFHRKIMHQALNARATTQYHPMQVAETQKYLLRIMQNPSRFLDETRRLAGSTIMLMAYGYEMKEDDSYVSMVEDAVYGLTQTLGVGFLVDVMPILRLLPDWVPGTKFKKLAKEWRRSTRGILEMPWAVMMESYSNGTAIPSYCSRLLDSIGGSGCDTESELAVKETSAVIYAAGADSTTALISSFILAMVLHPEVQAKAQAELDGLLTQPFSTTKRLPTHDDRSSLPYLSALIKEVYRWNPAAPLGVAHRLTQDDVYEGHWIPEGTTVIPNIWAMLHDEQVYPDPMSFNPERFLSADSLLPSSEFDTPLNPDPRLYAFGFGRRICVGQHFADSALFVALASLLSTFSFSKVRDAVTGAEIEPEVAYPSFVGHPKPFSCDIRVRDGMEDVVRDATGDFGL